jgi:hypothetical protein
MPWDSKKCRKTGTHFSTINICYADTNNVYTISRTNEYQIVLIDGYDRPKLNATGQQKNATA